MGNTRKTAPTAAPDRAGGAQTTIVAASFNGGVVLGADSRTSNGDYVANRVTDKLTQLTDRVRLRSAAALSRRAAPVCSPAWHAELLHWLGDAARARARRARRSTCAGRARRPTRKT